MSFGSWAFAELSYSAVAETSVTFYGANTVTVTREFRIFSATQEFVTKDSDALPTQPFFGTLVQPLSFTRSLLGSDIIGQFSSGTGTLEIANTDGTYDFLIQGFAIDGRPIVVKVGREGEAYDSFYTIFSGTASDWVVKEDVVQIKLVDNGYLLDVPVQVNTFAGTGGAEGTADLKGKRKPRCFGLCYHISPPLVIPTSLVYQVNDGSIQGVDSVYDRGVALTFSANYATLALLLAASIPSGNYATCLADGYFRLNTTPSGVVTANVFGDNSDGYVSTSADIVRTLLDSSSVADPAGLYVPSFDAVNLLQGADIGYYVDPESTNTIADAIADIMGGIGGWGGFRRSGQFELGIFQAPNGAIPHVLFDRTDILQIGREALPSSLSPPPYRFRCGYQHCWTVQTDVAAGTTAAWRSFLAQADRYSDSIDNDVKIDHPFAHDRDPIRSYFTLAADAQAESDRLLNLYARNAALYRFTVGVQPFAFDLGDVVNLTYPRWDLRVGKNLRIVEMTENAADNTIELVCYG